MATFGNNETSVKGNTTQAAELEVLYDSQQSIRIIITSNHIQIDLAPGGGWIAKVIKEK